MLLPRIFENDFNDSLFDDMFQMPFDRAFQWGFQNPSMSSMSTDVQEFDDKYQLDLELPGFQKEDIQAELKDGYLTISAAHDEKKDEKDNDGRYIRRERSYGSCQRKFYVGDAVTKEDIKASFENGVLKLDIPKKEAAPELENKHYISIEG